MPAEKTIYKVRVQLSVPVTGLEGSTRERLVSASSKSAALRHVVADSIVVEKAGQRDLIRLAGEHVEVEEVAE